MQRKPLPSVAWYVSGTEIGFVAVPFVSMLLGKSRCILYATMRRKPSPRIVLRCKKPRGVLPMLPRRVVVDDRRLPGRDGSCMDSVCHPELYRESSPSGSHFWPRCVPISGAVLSNFLDHSGITNSPEMEPDICMKLSLECATTGAKNRHIMGSENDP